MESLIGLADRSGPTAGVAGTVVISALDGMAGIGKTALAVHAAHRLAERFPDGQLFIDLHGYSEGYPPREPGEALEWLLRALGMPAEQIPDDTEARAALYRHCLADTRTLVVLDNVVGEAQVRPLLPAAPGCLVLITSRRRLKGLDDAHTVSLDLLAPPDAITLLRAVAGADRIPADDPALAEVAQLCGHLSIALRIAGALLRHRLTWSLHHLAESLRDQPRRMTTLSDGERDLTTVFDLSYTGLVERQRLLLRRLGLMPGPDVDAYAVAALLDTDLHTAAGLLENLVDHNLLISHAHGRYRLHDLVRAYSHALSGQDPAKDSVAAVDRLLHYYACTAQSASVSVARNPRLAPDGPPPAHTPTVSDFDTACSWLRLERDNLEAASAFAHSHALHGHAVALASGLAEILLADGPLLRALELHQTTIETAQHEGLPAAHAAALTDLGVARCLTGDLPESHDALTRAVEIYRDIGHECGEAMALTALGRERRLTGNPTGAEVTLTQALKIYRGIGHRHGEATALTTLGCVWILTGNLTEAEDALTRALDIYRSLGHRQGEANALTELGAVRSETGDLPAAAQALTQAIEIFRQTGHRSNEAWALNHYAADGDLPRALTLYQQAFTMSSELKQPDDEAAALEGLGHCHASIGQTQTGASHLHQALRIYLRLGMTPDVERVRTRLTDLARA